MKIRSVFFVALLVMGFVQMASAQRERTVANSFKFSGVWGGGKHQIADFGQGQSYMRGGHFGLEFGKSLFVGISSMSLRNDPWINGFAEQDFRLGWRGGTVGYAYQAHKAIHPTVNFDFGTGSARLDGQRDNIFVLQPSAGVEINLLRWLHLNVEGGYRFVNGSQIDNLTNDQISGAFGQLSLRFGWSWGKSSK